jgi:hypothetical protein
VTHAKKDRRLTQLERENACSSRRAVAVLQELYRASERFVRRVALQHFSTQRHGGKVVDFEEAKLRQRLRDIAAEHIRRPTPGKRKRALPADGSVRSHQPSYLPWLLMPTGGGFWECCLVDNLLACCSLAL